VNLDASKFLEDLSGRYARPYFLAVHDLFVALVRGNASAAADARQMLAEVTSQTMGAAEVLGASIMLRAAADLHARVDRFGADRLNLLRFRDESVQTILPRVTLSEALDDLVERTPVTLRNAAERTAQRIAQLYSSDRVIAFVRSDEQTITEMAQHFIARAFRDGIDEGEAGQRLAMSVNEIRRESAAWSEGYARMAFRTNVNTAVTAGRFRQSQDQDVRDLIPAFRFDAVGDADTRPNHAAADERIWKVDNPVWARLAPPLGYNCRCQVVHVSRFELEAMGRMRGGHVIEDPVPPGAFPDQGFRHGGRPDLFIAAVG